MLIIDTDKENSGDDDLNKVDGHDDRDDDDDDDAVRVCVCVWW